MIPNEYQFNHPQFNQVRFPPSFNYPTPYAFYPLQTQQGQITQIQSPSPAFFSNSVQPKHEDIQREIGEVDFAEDSIDSKTKLKGRVFTLEQTVADLQNKFTAFILKYEKASKNQQEESQEGLENQEEHEERSTRTNKKGRGKKKKK